MATLADSLKASSLRKLRLRKRSDLTYQEQRYQGRSYWVVKEPLGLKYFRFQEEEFSILQMLDGDVSLEDLKARFEKRFAPQKISFADLQQFIGMLHRNALVVSSTTGQGNQLHQRRNETRRKKWLAAASNILAIRFKGVDPERMLNRLYPSIAWFFSPLTVVLCCLMAIAAGSLILVQFDLFHSRLPAFEEFFGPKNWLLLGLTLAVTKILHELGHGFSCKHFGGECHEIGVMLLVLTPCLYCNVSDSWMLRSKWKRAAIGAAGMYVEIVLASIATFLWWFSEPGTLNHLALRVMFICSVSTILFNGNPLLRYDGYYILSDLVEIPNLRQKASSVLNRIMAKWCLGLELPEEPFLPKRNHFFFALYTVASNIYRWVVLISILFFLYKVFEPYGLQVIGQALAAFSIGSMVIRPLWKLGKFVSSPGRMEQVKRPNLYTSLGIASAVILVILLIPLPRRVICSLEIQPRDAVSVYVEVPGFLDQIVVESGQKVARGDPLARFANLDLRIDATKLRGQRDEYQTRLTSLTHERFFDKAAGDEIQQVREMLAAIEDQLREKNHDLGRLELVAPADGTILTPPRRTPPPRHEKALRQWSGSLLDDQNLGAFLPEGELFCQVGDPHRLEAILIIDQSDIALVQKDQRVTLQVEGYAGMVFEGSIEEIAESHLVAASASLSNTQGGDLATRTDKTGRARPISTSYTARVPLDASMGALSLDLRGRAKIHTGWQPLGGRIWRYLSHTFHFSL